jgi:hypothetical protein
LLIKLLMKYHSSRVSVRFYWGKILGKLKLKIR